MSTLYKAAGIVFFFNLLSKVLGFVRDAVLAAFFGAGHATDAYMIAYTLPYSLQAVLGMAFLTVMVPFLTDFLSRDKKQQAFTMSSVIITRVGIWMGVFVAAGMVFAGPLVQLLAPGFDPATQNAAIRLMVIMVPSLFFMSMGMLFTGILNAQKYFGLAAFGPALVNIVVILGIIFLSGIMGIYGAAIGTLLGFASFFVLLSVGIYKKGFRFNLRFRDESGYARSVMRGIIPVALSVSVNQVLLAVSRFFASGLEPGSISSLDFANRVMNLPLGIFTAAVVTATFPLLSEGAARRQLNQFAATFGKGFRAIFVFIIPVALGLLVLREPVVRILYQRGAFSADAALMTTGALYYFALALPAFSANMIMTRAYYAFANYRTPLIAGLLAILLNIGVSMVLVGPMGHTGLAAANATAAYAYAVLLFLGLKKRVPQLDTTHLVEGVVKSVAASLVMSFVVMSVNGYIQVFFEPGLFSALLTVFTGLVLGAFIYFVLLKVLQYDEIEEALSLLWRRRR